MNVYKKENKIEFDKFISEESKTDGTRRRIIPSLPIHTISDELLLKILKRNNISEDKIQDIIKSAHHIQDLTLSTIEANTLIDEIEDISNEEKFNESIPVLFIATNFGEEKIYYNYSEYLEHLELTKKFAEEHKNYTLKINANYTFKNIEIFIHEKKFVMISKHTDPSIHFVIYHPKLRNAIENFTPPIIEQ